MEHPLANTPLDELRVSHSREEEEITFSEKYRRDNRGCPESWMERMFELPISQDKIFFDLMDLARAISGVQVLTEPI